VVGSDRVFIRTESRTVMRSLHRAGGFLEDVAERDSESLLTQLSFDRRFTDTFTCAEARAVIKQRTAAEVGFDFGVEGFSSMIGLMLSSLPGTIVPSQLIRRFSRQVERCRRKERYSFFADVPEFAADTDSTAVAAGALYEHGLISVAELASSVGSLLLATSPRSSPWTEIRSPRDGETHPGVLQVYWDGAEGTVLRRTRAHDAVACVNALYSFSLLRASGAPREAGVIDATIRYVNSHLVTRHYRSGTRYYPTPEAFLYALSRLCVKSGAWARFLSSGLRREIAEIQGRPADDPLSLALSIISADNMCMEDGQQERREHLARLQQRDGSWPAAPYYRMGRFEVYFGSPLITTLFAAQAIQAECADRHSAGLIQKEDEE
jgi:hypothetical protein